MNPHLLYAFVATFFLVSITPGMCMTLAQSLGITVGVRRMLWMAVGELAGVALVAVAALTGVATLMLRYPAAFTVCTVFKLAGGLYLLFLGVQLWLSKERHPYCELFAVHTLKIRRGAEAVLHRIYRE